MIVMMKNTTHPANAPRHSARPRMPLPERSTRDVVLREVIGQVLREIRQDQNRTLREVSTQAQVSLGYLSEIERGQKEPSSELLGAICTALGIPLSLFLKDVTLRVYSLEQTASVVVPDTVPPHLMEPLPIG